MNLYKYKALDQNDEKIIGTLEAKTKEEAKTFLFNQKYIPIEIKKRSILNMNIDDLIKKNLIVMIWQ